MSKKKVNRCPRCKSSRLQKRLNGGMYCERCGQRWATHGLMIPSFDRRNIEGDAPITEEKQLLLTLNSQ